MATKHTSPAVEAAHSAAGYKLATNYVNGLRNVSADEIRNGKAVLMPVEAHLNMFRLEYFQAVREAAARRGAYNVRIRPEAILGAARFNVEVAVLADAALCEKQAAVQRAERDREHARISAEHRSYPALALHS
jgi:hypothetical protein